MFRLPQIALYLVLLAASLPALVGLITSGLTMASIGWESLAIWCLATVLAAAIWDRRLRYPSSLAAIVLASLAVASFASALVMPELDLTATGAVLTIMLLASGLARRADETSLAGFAAVALPASLAATPLLSTYLNDLVIGWATTTAGDLLHLANIAHVTRGDVVTTAGERFVLGYQIQSWASWPVMASLAILYSALMGRNWLHSLLMAAIAAPLCAAYHSGSIAMVSASEVWEWQWLPTSAWPWISALATAIAVLSADRIFELLLKPIESDENASRANPVVHAWNQFVKRPKLGDDEPHQYLSTFLIGAAVVLLATGWLAFPKATQGFAKLTEVSRRWNASPDIAAIVRAKGLTSDHFTTDRFVHRQWGRVSDVWIATASDALIEITVSQSPLYNVEPPFLMGTQWTQTPPPEPSPEAAPQAAPDEEPASAVDTNTTAPESTTEAEQTKTPEPAGSPEQQDPDASKTETPTEQIDGDAPEQEEPAQFQLPKVADGFLATRLYAAREQEAARAKDLGHAVTISCSLAADGTVVLDTQTPPAFWVRIVRRSATEPNSRQAQELADELNEVLAALKASL